MNPIRNYREGVAVDRRAIENMRAYQAARRAGGVVVGAVPETTWEHHSTRGIDVDLADAQAFIRAGNWGVDQDTGATAYRALIAASVMYMDLLSKDEPPEVPAPSDASLKATKLGKRDASQYVDQNRYEFAVANFRAINVMAYAVLKAEEASGVAPFLYPDALTVDGNAPVFPPNGFSGAGKNDPTVLSTGAVVKGGSSDSVFVGFGWYVVALVGIAAAGYLGQNALSIWNNHLQRQDNIANLSAAMGHVVDMQKNHFEAEQKAGKKLDYSQAEVDTINAMNKQSQTTADALNIANQPPVPNLFPDTGKVLREAEDTIFNTATVLAIGAGVLGFALLSKK